MSTIIHRFAAAIRAIAGMMRAASRRPTRAAVDDASHRLDFDLIDVPGAPG